MKWYWRVSAISSMVWSMGGVGWSSVLMQPHSVEVTMRIMVIIGIVIVFFMVCPFLFY